MAFINIAATIIGGDKSDVNGGNGGRQSAATNNSRQ
jgi:hypothetical protein